LKVDEIVRELCIRIGHESFNEIAQYVIWQQQWKCLLTFNYNDNATGRSCL